MTRLAVVSRNAALPFALNSAGHEVVVVEEDHDVRWGKYADAQALVLDLDDPRASLMIVEDLANSSLTDVRILLLASKNPGWLDVDLSGRAGVAVLTLPLSMPRLMATLDGLLASPPLGHAIGEPVQPTAGTAPEVLPELSEAQGATSVAAPEVSSTLETSSSGMSTTNPPAAETSSPADHAEADAGIPEPPSPTVAHELGTAAEDMARMQPSAGASAIGPASVNYYAVRRPSATAPDSQFVEPAPAAPEPAAAEIPEDAPDVIEPVTPPDVTESVAEPVAVPSVTGPPQSTGWPRLPTTGEIQPPRPRATSLARSLSACIDELSTVADTASVLLSEALQLVPASAGAVLVRDGASWTVSAGHELRPLEHRLVVTADHWLVRQVSESANGILLTGGDGSRAELYGAPLSARMHILAAPLVPVGAILLLARDDREFVDLDLEALIALTEEGGHLLADAVDVRRLARQLAPFAAADV